jgi:hypothetical protein
MNARGFFAELKRRNVYKVAVAYAIVGWLMMQVAATVVPALHLPDSLTTAVVVVVLLGFPIALVIAWAFEMTPEGMKRTENISPDEKLPQWSLRKFVAFFASLAILAAGLLIFRLVHTGPQRRKIRAHLRLPSRSPSCLFSMKAATRAMNTSPTAFPRN